MARSVTLVLGVQLVAGAGSGERGADVRARQSPPTIRSELDTFEITVGDPLSLTVALEHSAQSSVDWPDSIDLGSFELLDAVLMEPSREGDRVTSTVRFVLTAFELGDLDIPSFDVAVVAADSTATVLSTDAWTVTVASVGRDESGDIRDIKGPLEMSRNWLLLLPWALAVGAAGAVGYWLYRKYLRSRKTVAELEPAVPPKPPHELAHESLARLEAAGLLERGEIKEYHIEVSEIIRRYIEGRYRVDALEMATYEVTHGLERVGVEIDTRLQFDRFLADCDLVKFAKLRPAMEASREMIPRARRLVDETKDLQVALEADTEGEGDRETPVASAGSAASASPPRGDEQEGVE